MHPNAMLHVLTQDVRLGRALIDLCRSVEGLQIGGIRPVDLFTPALGALVVTPTPECTTWRCEQLSSGGSRVILLAPIPRDSERKAYFGAGAHAYVPMDLRSNELLATLRRARESLETWGPNGSMPK